MTGASFGWIVLSRLLACDGGGPSDPLSRYDRRYTEIQVQIGAAERDVARNVRNKEARERLLRAEQARVDFFQEAALSQAIDTARAATDAAVRAKGEAWHRDRLHHGAWTREEKEEEARLLAALESASSQEASWSAPDGSLTPELCQGGCTDVSLDADRLPTEIRAQLYGEYASFRMQVVGEQLQALVHLRNGVAARAGYDNYWSLSVATSGLTVGDVDTLIAELRPVVEPATQATRTALEKAAAEAGVPLSAAHAPMLRRRAGLEYTAEEADAYFDTDLAEERIVTAFQEMGLPAGGWQVYTEPRRYARAGVYGFPIRPPDNVAIVISQDRRWSTWPYEALAHEGGHAVWWQSLPEDAVTCPPLWSPPEPWFEGFAHLFEHIFYDPAFTARYIPELPAEMRDALSEARARRVADWILDSIIDTRVERRLYEDPSDLTAVIRYADQVRAELTGIPQEAGVTYAPTLLSELSWNYPGYSPNFLYAYSTESWLYAALVERAGGTLIGNPQVGPLLREHIIQAPPDQTFPQRIQSLSPTVSRDGALKDYLKPALLPPTPPPPEATASEGEDAAPGTDGQPG